MAPEQMRGRVGDARVDLYALGTMLYQMMTGRLPYAGADREAMLRAKRLEHPTPPSVHVPDIDPSLEEIILKAIEPAPADRYATAVDLLADLRDPSTVAPRVRERSRAGPRRRTDLRPIAAALTVIAALSGVGGIAWLSHRRVLESRSAAASAKGERPVTSDAAPARPRTVEAP